MSTSDPLPPSLPPAISSTLTRLSAYRQVRGVLILSRQGGIISSTGSVFEGEKGGKYAKVIGGMVESVRRGVGEVEEGDELKFLRIRTKRHELIITPDDKYLLVVLQDPDSTPSSLP